MRDARKGGSSARNVLGGELLCCCESPPTGFYRDGYCHTGPQDLGFAHGVRAHEPGLPRLLAGARQRPRHPAPRVHVSGPKAGDRWCLCVARWKEAFDAGVAPSVWLLATHERALDVVTLEQLTKHALDLQ